jgi:glycosyltransferase involved in cell wall biosynthesis
MRIVHVLHSRGYGGAENHALVLMKGQRAAGHEVTFAGLADSWLGRACVEAGIPVYNVRMAGVYDLWSAWQLRRFVHRWGADIVHGHLIRGARYAGLAGHLRRRPLAVCTAHATTARTHMTRCAHIIAVSEAVRQAVIGAGYQPDNVSTIWNGMPDGPAHADTDADTHRAALRAELGIPDGQLAWVNTGRFNADKAQDLLAQAWLALPEPIKATMGLHLIGDADNAYGREVRSLVAGDPRVRFLGYRNDVQRILPAFDAYALSSRREALGLSIIEAMAAGLPVVAARVGGVPEVVTDGETGCLVPANDAQALAKGMARLQDAALGRQWGLAGRARYLAHFTDRGMAQTILDLYARLLSAPLPRTLPR